MDGLTLGLTLALILGLMLLLILGLIDGLSHSRIRSSSKKAGLGEGEADTLALGDRLADGLMECDSLPTEGLRLGLTDEL